MDRRDRPPVSGPVEFGGKEEKVERADWTPMGPWVAYQTVQELKFYGPARAVRPLLNGPFQGLWPLYIIGAQMHTPGWHTE